MFLPATPKQQTQSLALHGRGGDSHMAHVGQGEFVLPKEMQTPGIMAIIHSKMRRKGMNPAAYQVGSRFNSINPATGAPEFNVLAGSGRTQLAPQYDPSGIEQLYFTDPTYGAAGGGAGNIPALNYPSGPPNASQAPGVYGGSGFSGSGIASALGTAALSDLVFGGDKSVVRNVLSSVPGVSKYLPNFLTSGSQVGIASLPTHANVGAFASDAVAPMTTGQLFALESGGSAASAIPQGNFAFEAAMGSGLPAGATLLSPAQEAAAIASGWAPGAGGISSLSALAAPAAIAGGILAIPSVAGAVKSVFNDNTNEAQATARNKVAELLLSGNNLSRAKHLLGLEMWDEGSSGFGDASPVGVQQLIDRYGIELPDQSRSILESAIDRQGVSLEDWVRGHHQYDEEYARTVGG